ncbi:MAG TPA: type IV secretion system DNA-binding domain-containing protein [Tepidisphaeraceae bacterium]|nr:type IV secretion system DNA-binding domain-containing protein [Tepidisphaeraceae bacterium]
MVFDDDNTIYIGQRHAWGGMAPFGVGRADRRHHTLILGQTGTGKTTLIRNLVVQAMLSGEGVGLLDRHGDLATELLSHVPRWRARDVVYFNPADEQYCTGINLLRAVPPNRRHLVASAVVDAFKSVYRASWGAKLEYVLYACVASLLECENVSLLGVPRMLVDARYRRWVVRQIGDPVLAAFWTQEFEAIDPRFLAEVVAPVQNKVSRLLLNPVGRRALGQTRNHLDARYLMDGRKIFIANLAKGRIGSDVASLLGSLLVTQFQVAAMSRADLPEAKRADFLLCIDEFGNFTTDSFASIMSEARKYRLAVVLGAQSSSQVSEEVRRAIFANVGSTVSFRVGDADAQILAREFGNEYVPSQFTSLSNHEINVRMIDRGELRSPFLGRALPPLALPYPRARRLIRQSRRRHARRSDRVDAAIRRWSSNTKR